MRWKHTSRTGIIVLSCVALVAVGLALSGVGDQSATAGPFGRRTVVIPCPTNDRATGPNAPPALIIPVAAAVPAARLISPIRS